MFDRFGEQGYGYTELEGRGGGVHEGVGEEELSCRQDLQVSDQYEFIGRLAGRRVPGHAGLSCCGQRGRWIAFSSGSSELKGSVERRLTGSTS